MDNSISFKGAFLVKRPTSEYKNAIQSVLGKKNQIFDNINNEGDVLYVVRKDADRNVAKFISENKDTKFTYFPYLSTKSGFDVNKPEGAIQILNDYKGLIISTVDRLLSKVRTPLKTFKSNIRNIQARNLKLMQQVTTLDFSDKAFRKIVDTNTGVCIIKTPVTDAVTGKKFEHTLLTITPPGKYGVCYAEYTPVSKKDNVRRIAIKNGEKIFEYLAPASDKRTTSISIKNTVEDQFDMNVADAKKFYKQQLAKKSAQSK